MTTSAGPEVACTVWLARVGEAEAAGLDGVLLLDAEDRARIGSLRRPADRNRSLVAAVLLRQVAGRLLGRDPRGVQVRRRCVACGGPHGKPAVDGLHVSVAHAGDAVLVVTSSAAQVGVDVEPVHGRADLRRAVRAACAPGEFSAAWGERDLLRVWTRKESVVKATGEGLAAPLADLRVSAPGQPARLVAWSGRPSPPCTLVDLDLPPDLVGSLTVLTPAPVRVALRPASTLLSPLTEVLR